jgi:N-acetylglucosamine-6-phosphate deacetylase
VEGAILCPDGWVKGSLFFTDRILEIRGISASEPGAGDRLILPGAVDLHVHGGGGADIMSGNGAIDVAGRLHAAHGTTSLIATTLTAPEGAISAALTDIGRAVRERAPGSARVLGAHLEGPFISPDKLGAQPGHARPGTADELRRLGALAPIRIVTLAPEVPGHLELIRALRGADISFQIGHTVGGYEEGLAALAAGARGFTHLFNAMTGLSHRAPGMAGAALALAEYAEIVPDLVHVHAGALRVALRSIPKLYAVTDATSATGMPDGVYRLGTRAVIKRGNGVHLETGTLAGSALTMDVALRNLVSLGVDLASAVRRVSTYPADYLGLTDRGRLAGGCWADLLVMTPQLEIEAVYVEGERIEPLDPV